MEEATKWGCITKKEFKEITNKDYKE
ncbi:hypothetical protein RSJ22_12630 [Clostridium botulinum]|nr:hypothetical protein RSJ22_12630 [Clostridium botulinum]